jgi:hypothetical protein
MTSNLRFRACVGERRWAQVTRFNTCKNAKLGEAVMVLVRTKFTNWFGFKTVNSLGPSSGNNFTLTMWQCSCHIRTVSKSVDLTPNISLYSTLLANHLNACGHRVRHGFIRGIIGYHKTRKVCHKGQFSDEMDVSKCVEIVLISVSISYGGD